jgi:hypothetical protein
LYPFDVLPLGFYVIIMNHDAMIIIPQIVICRNRDYVPQFTSAMKAAWAWLWQWLTESMLVVEKVGLPA